MQKGEKCKNPVFPPRTFAQKCKSNPRGDGSKSPSARIWSGLAIFFFRFTNMWRFLPWAPRITEPKPSRDFIGCERILLQRMFLMRLYLWSTKTREVLGNPSPTPERISRVKGMDFIPCFGADIMSSSIFLQGVDQKILPCGQGRIGSVKMNPSLLMMTEWPIHWPGSHSHAPFSSPRLWCPARWKFAGATELWWALLSQLWCSSFPYLLDSESPDQRNYSPLFGWVSPSLSYSSYGGLIEYKILGWKFFDLTSWHAPPPSPVILHLYQSSDWQWCDLVSALLIRTHSWVTFYLTGV